MADLTHCFYVTLNEWVTNSIHLITTICQVTSTPGCSEEVSDGVRVSRELDLMGSDYVWLEYLELLPYEKWRIKNLTLMVARASSTFPEIECEMKEIRSLELGGNGARELPSSFGRLTGLARLCLTKCKNLIYLPSSISQLQKLEYLSLYGCPNPIKLGNKEEDNRKSMTFKCSSKDFELDLSRSDIVSLSSSIGRFFGLKTLRLSYCDNLQEIPELPPNIQEVYASGCNSLKSFPEVSKKFKFKTSDLSKLRWVDLFGRCKMLVEVGNSVPWGIHDHPRGIIFPGDKIPDFFRYYEEDLHVFSCDINDDRQYLRGIFLCLVINGTSQLRRPAVRMLGRGFRWCGVSRELDLMGSDHVWLEYLELLPYEKWCINGRCYAQQIGTSVDFENTVYVQTSPSRCY